jgi:hypothetical protein
VECILQVTIPESGAFVFKRVVPIVSSLLRLTYPQLSPQYAFVSTATQPVPAEKTIDQIRAIDNPKTQFRYSRNIARA